VSSPPIKIVAQNVSKKEILIWIMVALLLHIPSVLLEDYSTLDASDIVNFVEIFALVVMVIRVSFERKLWQNK
jgi:hypothetical protein